MPDISHIDWFYLTEMVTITVPRLVLWFGVIAIVYKLIK